MIAAAEIGIGLAIVLLVYRNRRMIDVDRLRDLAEDRTDERPVRPARPDAEDGAVRDEEAAR